MFFFHLFIFLFFSSRTTTIIIPCVTLPIAIGIIVQFGVDRVLALPSALRLYPES
jgi:hypothetical protein